MPPRGEGPVARPARSGDGIDALAWTVALALAALLPAGRVSGDGLRYATQIADGTWGLNPNHLLLEPLAALWSAVARAAGMAGPIVDQLRIASGLAAAIAVGLFRWAVAPRLTRRRSSANLSTAWLVLGASFAQASVSDEIHMIRLPILMVAAVGVLCCLERPTVERAALTGMALGIAALMFSSDGLLALTCAIALAIPHLLRREWGRAGAMAGAVLLGAVVIAGAGMGLAWSFSRPELALPAWLTSYGGGRVSARTDLVFGTPWSWSGAAGAALRSAFGAGNTLVDLAPAIIAVRDEHAPAPAALIGAVWLLGALALGHALLRHFQARHTDPVSRRVLTLQAIWWPPVLAFALYWNDSKDQFYLPLSIALAVLVAALPPSAARAEDRATSSRRRGASIVSPVLSFATVIVLGWNAADVWTRFVRYPRAEWIATLERATDDAGLVVMPGWDDATNLATLSTRLEATPQVALAPLAVDLTQAEGLRELERAIVACLASGRRVDLVDLFDVPPLRAPWKLLLTLGWKREDVHRTLEAHGVEGSSRRAGPFTVRSIHPRAGESPSSSASIVRLSER